MTAAALRNSAGLLPSDCRSSVRHAPRNTRELSTGRIVERRAAHREIATLTVLGPLAAAASVEVSGGRWPVVCSDGPLFRASAAIGVQVDRGRPRRAIQGKLQNGGVSR